MRWIAVLILFHCGKPPTVSTEPTAPACFNAGASLACCYITKWASDKRCCLNLQEAFDWSQRGEEEQGRFVELILTIAMDPDNEPNICLGSQ